MRGAAEAKIAVTVHAAVTGPVVYGLVVPGIPPQPLIDTMLLPGSGVTLHVVVAPNATGLPQEIEPPPPETAPVTAKVSAFTVVLAVAELLPGVASAVAEPMLTVAVTLPANAGAIVTISVKFALPPAGYDARLQLTVPVPPTAGVVHVQPPGAASEAKVVFAGTAMLNAALAALLGPLLVVLMA